MQCFVLLEVGVEAEEDTAELGESIGADVEDRSSASEKLVAVEGMEEAPDTEPPCVLPCESGLFKLLQ